MSGIISGLAGAGGAANTAGSYYQNALNQLMNQYSSPAADRFSQEYEAALKPGFQDQQQGLIGSLNALGIANSGAAKANLSDLYGRQSAAEAQGVAPLYQQGLQEYGSILSQEPSAQNAAYQNAIQNFYAALSDAGSLAAGMPPTASTSGGGDFGSGGSDPYIGAPGDAGSSGYAAAGDPYAGAA